MAAPTTLDGRGKYIPTPAILHREDHASKGKWEVLPCAAQRGVPATTLGSYKMAVPMDDRPLSRVIRAHEMMHAKTMPVTSVVYDRNLASRTALEYADEARVNFLCQKAGFDMRDMKIEQQDREAGVASANKWKVMVLTVAGWTGTGGFKSVVSEIRKTNPEFADKAREIDKALQKMLEKAWKTGKLASTKEVGPGFPESWQYVEEIAMWLDEVIGQDPAEQNPPPPMTDNPPPPMTDGEIEGDEVPPLPDAPTLRAKSGDSCYPRMWTEVIEETMSMPRAAPGGLGKKRVASDIGRVPRRMNRMLTDGRVFDRKVKMGKGGVVVIDISGSMSLKRKDIVRIVEAAPGATVAAYGVDVLELSDQILAAREGKGRIPTTKPNLHILAQKGRMIGDMPEFSTRTNGNDVPVLQWALAKAKAHEPILWISDGAVHFGAGGHFGDEARKSMLKLLTDNPRIAIRRHVDEAVTYLTDLAAGRKPVKRTQSERSLLLI